VSEPSKELIDQIERDKLRRAARMSPGDRLLAGPRLFDLACEFTKAGLRAQNPDASEAEIHEMLRARLRLARKLEGPHG
jgi:hypothetical protein